MLQKGAKQLASSRFSSNQPDVTDVTVTLAAFQVINNVKLTITGSLVSIRGETDLCLEVEAHDGDREIGEAPSLASARLNLGSSRHKTMETALMFLLYQVDAQLARVELGGSEP